MTIKFYRPSEKPYGCFSNFSRHSISLDSHIWPTTEHYFQAQKTKDRDRYFEILKASTPKEAAALGRDRSIPIKRDWEQIKDDVMRKCVFKKFETYADIREILLNTGQSDIVEDSPYDDYWGIGRDGNGKNMLGKILVETREKLRLVPV